MDDKMKVYKGKKIEFNAYFKAGILSIFIFLSGLAFGIFIDNYRISEIRKEISQVEISSLDALLLSSYFQKFSKNVCEDALEMNLKFNEEIYSEGKRIEESVKTNLFTPELDNEWRRYILLQVQFWLNSIELKKNCNFNYSNVVHFFKFKISDPQEIAINKLQSEILLSLKEKCGRKIMLIPITVDNNLTIVDSLIRNYNIKEFPSILINEEKLFSGLTSFEKLNEITKC